MQVLTVERAHETQRERVYFEIRRALMAGDFEPGQKITIGAVASALGVSATPVREALRRLTAERALIMRPNRSVVVPRLSRAEVLKIREIRCLLEGEAAAEAAGCATEDEIDQLSRLQVAMAGARDRRDRMSILRLNEQFHFVVYNAARIAVLIEIIETLWLRSAPTMNILFQPQFMDRYPADVQNRNNLALIDALRQRVAEDARQAVQREIAEGSNLLDEIMVEIGWDEQAAGAAPAEPRHGQNNSHLTRPHHWSLTRPD